MGKRKIVVALSLVTVVVIGFVLVNLPTDPHVDLKSISHNDVPPQYAISSLDSSDYRNSTSVQKAVDFIKSLQPEGTYILTSPGQDDVVHMDVAHSVIALAKVKRVSEAKSAMNWLLGRMTRTDDEDAWVDLDYDGQVHRVSYAGSWWDHFHTSGKPYRDKTRGRGEGVGMALIAVYSIYQEDPHYLDTEVSGQKVGDYVVQAARYLSSSAVQKPDGRFNHRPDYRVSFDEECARMALGLKLAAQMVARRGDGRAIAAIEQSAEKGLAALNKGDGINKGMAFDYYAKSLWGIAKGDAARLELASLRQASLVTSSGVKNWDWQQLTAAELQDKIKWWAVGQAIGPAQTFDWGMANIIAGDLYEAFKIEGTWLPLQRTDGGFAGTYLLGGRVPLGPPTSYTAARFILFERMLTEVVNSKEA